MEIRNTKQVLKNLAATDTFPKILPVLGKALFGSLCVLFLHKSRCRKHNPLICSIFAQAPGWRSRSARASSPSAAGTARPSTTATEAPSSATSSRKASGCGPFWDNTGFFPCWMDGCSAIWGKKNKEKTEQANKTRNTVINYFHWKMVSQSLLCALFCRSHSNLSQSEGNPLRVVSSPSLHFHKIIFRTLFRRTQKYCEFCWIDSKDQQERFDQTFLSQAKWIFPWSFIKRWNE